MDTHPRPARWRACRRPSLLARPSRTAASSLGCHRVYWGGKNIQTTPIGYVLYGLDNAKQRQTKSTKIHIRVLISSGDIRVWPRRWPTASAFKNGKQAERLKEGREGGREGVGQFFRYALAVQVFLGSVLCINMQNLNILMRNISQDFAAIRLDSESGAGPRQQADRRRRRVGQY